MKKMMYVIIKKEILEAFRTSKLQAVMSILFPLFLQYSLIQRYVKLAAAAHGQNPQATEMLKFAPTLSLMYVAPIIIPFFANALLSKSFIQEKASGALMPILATGMNLGVLWCAKMLAVFFYCYIAACIGVVIDVAMIVLYFKLTISLSAGILITVFVISPLAALAITAIMSFIYWTFRFANILASFLPILVAMACFSYALMKPTTYLLIKGVSLVTVLACVIIVACGYAVSKLRRGFVLGL